jgi:hypothetical protein
LTNLILRIGVFFAGTAAGYTLRAVLTMAKISDRQELPTRVYDTNAIWSSEDGPPPLPHEGPCSDPEFCDCEKIRAERILRDVRAGMSLEEAFWNHRKWA